MLLSCVVGWRHQAFPIPMRGNEVLEGQDENVKALGVFPIPMRGNELPEMR